MIQAAIAKKDEADDKQLKEIEKVLAKAYKAAAKKTKAKSKARSSNDKPSDDEVEISTVNPNKSTSLTFWRQQSANDLRTQLKLRDLQRFKDEWAFKTKSQLFEIIRQLIKTKQW